MDEQDEFDYEHVVPWSFFAEWQQRVRPGSGAIA
jgi:hypothetical protein